MTDRLGQFPLLSLRINGYLYELSDVHREAARREAEYERPKPTPGVKFYCSAVPERTSCWGSNCPPDGCGYPVDERRKAEGCAAATVTATGPGAVATGQHPDANTPARPDAPPPSAPDLDDLLDAFGLNVAGPNGAVAANRAAIHSYVEALRADAKRLREALEVRTWTYAERDGMDKAYDAARQGRGHYESLFAVGAWLLRHRTALAQGGNDG